MTIRDKKIVHDINILLCHRRLTMSSKSRTALRECFSLTIHLAWCHLITLQIWWFHSWTETLENHRYMASSVLHVLKASFPSTNFLRSRRHWRISLLSLSPWRLNVRFTSIQTAWDQFSSKCNPRATMSKMWCNAGILMLGSWFARAPKRASTTSVRL